MMTSMLWFACTLLAAALPQEKSVNPEINKNYREIEAADDVLPWVERFEREGREIYEQREKIAATLGVKAGMVVADVGAGTGLFTGLFAAQVGAEGKVIAVDIVAKFLEHIAARMAEEGTTNVETLLCAEDDSRLPEASVDRIFLCDTYHHFEYPQKTMASLHRALREEGELLLIDFKRIEGVSSDFILGHVRASQEVFEAEVVAAGFVKVEELGFLEENFVVRFRKAPREP